MREYEIVVIGGGSAGLAAAISAYESGCRSVLLLERDRELGGILLQCIHNGFGLHLFKEEMSGPAYAERWVGRLLELGIEYRVGTMVTHLSPDKVVSYVNPTEGYAQVRARAVILAMGCRERTRGAIQIPGYRPSGIWTAGTAQRYLNMSGILVGRQIFILGSGDIGLIMARRMTLEGAKVLGVAEIMPYSNGLPRNMKQCLEDFGIPLYLSHTVTDIRGRDRLRGVEICQVDESLRPIPGTEKKFDADTLLLSVGLIPENSLSEEAGVALHPKTRGAVVNERLETSVEGVFACGNVLHVHDLVDFVSEEGTKAGANAARYVMGKQAGGEEIPSRAADGIGYVLPQRIRPANVEGDVEFMFRVTREVRNGLVRIYKDGELLKEVRRPHMVPAEMEKVRIGKEELAGLSKELSFAVEQRGNEA